MSLLFFFQGISIDMDFCGPIKEISNIVTHYQDHKVYGDSFLDYVVEDYFGKEAKDETAFCTARKFICNFKTKTS